MDTKIVKLGSFKCRNCGDASHLIYDCPEVKCKRCGEKGHMPKDCTEKACSHCGKFNHTSDKCWVCNACNQRGHGVRNCPTNQLSLADRIKKRLDKEVENKKNIQDEELDQNVHWISKKDESKSE